MTTLNMSAARLKDDTLADYEQRLIARPAAIVANMAAAPTDLRNLPADDPAVIEFEAEHGLNNRRKSNVLAPGQRTPVTEYRGKAALDMSEAELRAFERQHQLPSRW